MGFQAKDIQKIVGIKKYRYEYLATKIGIIPEVDEVEGTGHVHLYSFKNLLEFAFSHYASSLGLTPKAVKSMLHYISNNPELKDAKLFEPKEKTSAFVHRVTSGDQKYFRISGTSLREQDIRTLYMEKGFDEIGELLSKTRNRDKEITVIGLPEALQRASHLTRADLKESDGYVTINLGAIKDRILYMVNDL